jgi:aspartate carbamoyltransferase catalytic subunit
VEYKVQRGTKGMLEIKVHKDLRVQRERMGYKGYQARKVYKATQVNKANKVQQDLRVLGSAMEMPRATSSTGMGLLGRT